MKVLHLPATNFVVGLGHISVLENHYLQLCGDWLGHKHPSTTMVYAHLTSKSVAAYNSVVDAIMNSL